MTSTNEAYWICAQTGVPPLAIGMPGIAKTRSVYAFAKAMERKVYTLIGSIRDPADIGGYPYPGEVGVNGSSRSVMKLIPPQWAADCCESGDKWIVFMDELTTCPPSVQSALLRVLAEKVVGDLELPEDTWILSACNPPEQAANGIELEAAMANRLFHHKWEAPVDAILAGYANGLQFAEPTFPKLPDNWRDYIGTVGGMVAAFHKHLPGRLTQFPEEQASQAGPWASPRTWDYVIRCKAACRAIGAEPGVELQLTSGLVGDALAVEYSRWEESLDLPDPEELLAEATAAQDNGREMNYHHPDRPDKVMAMLSGVAQAVINSKTTPRWEAGMAVFEATSKKALDVTLGSAIRPFVRAMPKDAKTSTYFREVMAPKVAQALVW